MHVGTFSGVKSPGMVISSALGGTSKGNSSDTNDKINDVFPTFLYFPQKMIKIILTFDNPKFVTYLSPTRRILTSLRFCILILFFLYLSSKCIKAVKAAFGG